MRAKAPQHAVVKHPNGLIAVEQGRIGQFDLTFNPDDERWYVHQLDENRTVVTTQKYHRNATTFARTH